ncbi:MAG: hypothetical protein J6Y47_04070 [Bacteroidales bacterium]|nr:hypothetical protein [Bacteroidales bacterium]
MKKGHLMLMAMCAIVCGFMNSCKEDDDTEGNKGVKYELEKTLVGEWDRMMYYPEIVQPYIETRKYVFNADHTGYVDYYGDVVEKGVEINRRVDVRSWIKIDFTWKVESDSTFEICLSKANLRYGEEAARDTVFAQGDTFKYFLTRAVTDTLDFYSCGYFLAGSNHVLTESCGESVPKNPACRLELVR